MLAMTPRILLCIAKQLLTYDCSSSNPSTRAHFCRPGIHPSPRASPSPSQVSARIFLLKHALLTGVIYRVGTEVIIRLKWGQTEYKGTLESIDSYMNVLLRDTVEFIDGKETGSLGLVLIRYVLTEWHSTKQSWNWS